MNSYDFIKYKQRIWVKSRRLRLLGSKIERGEKNYTSSLEENLFMPLTEITEDCFRTADGNELDGYPCKMQALHSSSALAVNIFQYWMDKDVSVIASACGLCEPISNIKRKILFEQKYAISDDFNKHPNIDVIIKNPEEHKYRVYAIECKFSEPYSNRKGYQDGLKEKYITETDKWSEIPNIFELAKSISPNDTANRFLHSAQLIKHILGLKRVYGKDHFRLLYLWYDALGEDGYKHRLEIEEFKDIIKKDNVAIHSISYQELFFHLHNKCNDSDIEYLNYIEQRYL
jgi:hypothetical protein